MHGGMLLGETLPGGARLEYLRDAGGTAYGMIYTTAGGTRYTYYYLFDLQGNVTALVRSNGNLIATYEYDAWGRPYGVKDANGDSITSETHVARLNPYRYRGYYYDEETGFYYCGSRYYDPIVCRWLNADGYTGTGQGILGYDMFAYCLNDPVSGIDINGRITISFQINASLGAVLGVAQSQGICFDTQGNFERIDSYSVPGIENTAYLQTSFWVGFGFSVQITNKDTIYELEGTNSGLGVNVGAFNGELIFDGEIAEICRGDVDGDFAGVQITIGPNVSAPAVAVYEYNSVTKVSQNTETNRNMLVFSDGCIHGRQRLYAEY